MSGECAHINIMCLIICCSLFPNTSMLYPSSITSVYPKRFATSSKEMQVNERSMEEMLDDEHGSRV